MDPLLVAVIVGVVLVILSVWLTPLLSEYNPVPSKLGGPAPSGNKP